MPIDLYNKMGDNQTVRHKMMHLQHGSSRFSISSSLYNQIITHNSPFCAKSAENVLSATNELFFSEVFSKVLPFKNNTHRYVAVANTSKTIRVKSDFYLFLVSLFNLNLGVLDNRPVSYAGDCSLSRPGTEDLISNDNEPLEVKKTKSRSASRANMNPTKQVLDKFYTKPDVACTCVAAFQNAVTISVDDLIVEPSAGNGSFIKSISSINCEHVFLDIAPDHALARKADFLQ